MNSRMSVEMPHKQINATNAPKVPPPENPPAKKENDALPAMRCSTPAQQPMPMLIVPETPPHKDSQMQDQGPNSQTKQKANNSDSDDSSQHSEDLLSQDKLTILFFTAEFIVAEELKHLLKIHLTPFEWKYQGLGICMYTDQEGQDHPHVVSFTAERHLIDKLEIQFMDVNTIYTHEFVYIIVETDDPAIVPQEKNESLEKWAKGDTIRCLKGTCPNTDEARAFFDQAFWKGTTTFGITKEITLFLQNTVPARLQATAESV